jgi:hypothetical protein
MRTLFPYFIPILYDSRVLCALGDVARDDAAKAAARQPRKSESNADW